MSIEDVNADLLSQGLNPIWKWKEWHSSRDIGWKNDNTLHAADWDNLHTHDHELNHLRFYISYLSVIKDRDNVFFVDDDILVRTDLGQIAAEAAEKVDPSKGLTCPCNVWTWVSGSLLCFLGCV
jgi:hypothetical protein